MVVDCVPFDPVMDANQLLDLHTKRFAEHDLEGILSEYAEDAVLITAQGVLKGVDAIRPLFVAMFEEFSGEGVSFDLLARHADGDHGYLAWKAETAKNRYELGSDTLVLRDGKIVAHTAAIHAIPK